MATNYPTSLDTGSTTLRTDITATTELDDVGFYHDEQHVNAHGAVIAVETKLGVGSSDASAAGAGTVLVHSGSGSTGWSAAATGVTSVGTLSSLTVSGDVTVDTDTLHVDSTNNRVGIGTTSPSGVLAINKALGTGANDTELLQEFVSDVGSNTSALRVSNIRESAGGSSWNSAHHRIQHRVDSTDMAYIDFNPESAEQGLAFGTGNTEKVTIDYSGNVGINDTTPSFTLDVNGQARVGGGDNRTPDASGDGHLMIDGNGYTGFASLDGSAMWVGHNSGSRSLYLATDETARLTVTGTGQVGIGTTSIQANHILEVRGRMAFASATGTGYSHFPYTDGRFYYTANPDGAGTGDHIFRQGTSYTEQMRILENGNVGIGETSPTYKLHANEYSSGNRTYPLAVTNGFSGGGGVTNTEAAIWFATGNSTSTNRGAYISARNTGGGSNGHDLIFATSANTQSPLEKMRLTLNGHLGVGTNNPAGRLHVYDGASLLYTQSVTGAQNLFLPVVYARTTASAGTSQRLESSGQFRRSTSAAKYKKDIEDMDVDRAEVVYDLRPVWYRSAIETDRQDHSYYGFIADEVVGLDPRLVEFDDETGEVEGFFYPMLTSHLVKIAQMQKATIDSQQAQIDDLAARIEALGVN